MKLKLYLALESIRFEDTFTYNITVDPNIKVEEKLIPPMIIQPYIENALKHGLLHRKTNRKLNINFAAKDDETICCSIEDNGIGRNASMQINEKRVKKFDSFSTSATSRRLELLNHGKHKTIGVEYHDLTDEDGLPMGTLVKIFIPVR